jgi:hypothetical protein
MCVVMQASRARHEEVGRKRLAYWCHKMRQQSSTQGDATALEGNSSHA